jgi:outer membrane protein TolC
MRMSALFLILMATALPMAPARAQDKENPSPPQQSEQVAKKINQLRQERITTLKEVVEQVSTMHNKGLASIDEVYEARLAVMQAELDAAAEESNRVALYKNIVDLLAEWEHSANEMRKTVRTEGTSYLKVKARRLHAEINWEQAKAKAAQASH